MHESSFLQYLLKRYHTADIIELEIFHNVWLKYHLEY